MKLSLLFSLVYLGAAAPYNTCTGTSTKLEPAQCQAWLEFYDATNNVGMGGWNSCKEPRTDPCACTGPSGKDPVCSTDGTTVQQIRLIDNNLDGTLPASIANWTDMRSFIIASNPLTGEIPQGISAWTKLVGFNVEDVAFSGTLPSLPFQNMPGTGFDEDVCMLGGNRFSCPWPANVTEDCHKMSSDFTHLVPITDSDCTPQH
jgi:hypothetical protein